jgi:1,4-alpha-glucan branching enzyme
LFVKIYLKTIKKEGRIDMIKKTIKNNKRNQKRVGNRFNKKDVEFSFYAPEAIKVFIAGEFNGWDIQSLPMKRQRDGIWKRTTKLLPGRYEYKVFADREWVEDLPGEEGVTNPYGTQNFIKWVK